MPIDPRVIDLLLRYEELRQAGQDTSVEELCRDCPQLLEEVRRRVKQIAGLERLLGDTAPGGAAAPALAGLRYRPVRFHAKGGLGEVHVAEDGELGRPVALKRIQDRHAHSEEMRRRFLREAEITARLEHPGIVPVYGLVHDADGQPCYAMRFIEGESLRDAIDRFHQADAWPGRDPGERRLALRELLGRFVAVCHTVAFAHSRGVVHRDLKPANVMLGPYGETLVVDWGLAKQVAPAGPARAGEETLPPAADDTADATRPGQAAGTPAYVSPEQAAGRWDAVGPASDQYSLGCTLYALLTGRPPFTGRGPEEALAKAERGDFPPPRRVRRDVPPALEAVCMKAMALKPQDRYASVSDLAADVRNWLDDVPVAAWPEPLPVRLGRWARRHKPLVSGAAALLVTAVVLLAVGLVLLGDKQRETDRQRRRAEANAAQAAQAERAAAAQARRAREQRGLTLDALKTVVLAGQQELKAREDRLEPLDKAGIRALRTRLLDKAVAGLRRVAGQAERSAEADHHAVLAHLDLGDLFVLTDKTGEAERHYRSACDLARALVRADAADVRARRDLSAAWDKVGDVSLLRGRTEAALRAYRESLRLAGALARARPDDTRARRDLSVSYNKLGDVSQQRGRTEAAREAYAKALAFRKELVRARPGDVQARRDLASSYSNLGAVNQRLGRTGAALDACREALRIDRAVAEARPDDAGAQRDLAVAYDNLGDLICVAGRAEDGLEAYQNARRIWERLARADPHSTQAQRDLALGCTHVGNVALDLGQVRAARDAYARALKISQKLAAADPDNRQAQRDVAVAWNSLGDAERQRGRTRAALEAYRQAVRVTQALARADPESLQARMDLGVSSGNVGTACLLLGRAREALEAFTRALEIDRAVARADPGDAEAQRNLAQSCDSVGDANLELDHPRAARDAYAEALRIRKALDPHNRAFRREQSVSYAKLSQVRVRLGQGQAALDAARECVRIRDELAGADPENAQAASDLLEAYGRLGRVSLQRGRPTEARAACQKALAVAARLRGLAKVQPDHLVNLAGAYVLGILTVAPGKAPGELTASEWAAREEYAARAVGVLREAIGKGYRNVENVKKEKDLDPLRSRKDFRELLAGWERDLAREGD
jgi:serine/threonine protein kinase/tetratricopeptide (TPR) repeat protein